MKYRQHPARSADQDGHRDRTYWGTQTEEQRPVKISRGFLPGLMSKHLTDTKAVIRLLWALGMKRTFKRNLEDKRSWSATDREGRA